MMTMFMNGEEIQLIAVPRAHTDGDTMVYFPGLDVIMTGGPSYSQVGTAGSSGTKLFCLSGAVSRPGVYEVPFGATLRQMIDMADGVPAEPATMQR